MIKRRCLLRALLLTILVRHFCFANNDTKAPLFDRTGLVGAVPEENLMDVKKAIACEGQKLFIGCPNIYDRIQVQSTFYGREDAKTCKHPELPSEKICTEQNVTVANIVKDLCQGESTCEVAATNDFLAQFGTIICQNVYKYLYVIYRCVPRTVLPDAPGTPPYDHTATTVRTNYAPVHANYAPVQCCYMVPSLAASTAASTVGGTIVSHKEGIQSVEERIVSEVPQVQQSHKVTEIIHGRQAGTASAVTTLPANIPLLRITAQPGSSQVQMSTQVQGGVKVGSNVVTVGLPQRRSEIMHPKEKGVIKRPSLNQQKTNVNKLHKKGVLKRPSLTHENRGQFYRGKVRTSEVTAGSPKVKSNINKLERKGVLKRHSLSIQNRDILMEEM